MDVGKLDKRITIERREKGHGSRNAAGEPNQTWTKVKNVWANVRFERGMEAIRNGKDTAVKRASMRIRKRNDIDESMRVIYGHDIFEINAILPDPDGTNTYMDLVVEAQN